ncbi:MAG: hypothetical protein PVH18_09395 [Chloroflexota bacterium]|jgi:hypothetical protein
MSLDDFNWSAPAIAMLVGIGIGVVLILTRGIWKALPGWVKFLFFVAIVVVLVLFALGRLPLP